MITRQRRKLISLLICKVRGGFELPLFSCTGATGGNMKAKEIIELTDELKPNQYSENLKLGWLSTLDIQIYGDVMLTHEDCAVEAFSGHTDINDELLVGEPYSDMYRYYLESMIDYANQEIAKYNNSSSMFQARYSDFCKYYNRTHMPVHPVNGPMLRRRI